MTTDYSDLPVVLASFLRNLRVVKNRSPKTVYEYMINLRMFTRFIAANQNMKISDDELDAVDISKLDASFYDRLTLEDAYSFLAYCADVRQVKEAARARIVSAIRSFYKYLFISNQLTHDNVMQLLESPKQRKSLPKYLTLEQSKALLSSVSGKYRARDYCILVLFLNCGLRLSELVGLNCSDIQDNTMVVTGKGNKQRLIYLNDACLTALHVYMQQRPVDGVKDKDALFLSNRLTRISNRAVQYIVEEFLNKSGLAGKGFSTHKLRHTAATLMYQYGHTDIRVLKEILGHENLNTTEIYTHVVNEQMQYATDNNPLGSVRPNQKSSDSGKETSKSNPD